jgi:hypothetical protein
MLKFLDMVQVNRINSIFFIGKSRKRESLCKKRKKRKKSRDTDHNGGM